MTNVVDQMPMNLRSLLVELLGASNPELLTSLLTNEEPTPGERVAVHEILTRSFMGSLTPDDEPTARGREIDDLLGAFLLKWPVEGEWFKDAPSND